MPPENIDDLPPLREVITTHDLRAQKSLGQNFLLDLNLTRKIARLAAPFDEVPVLEIGPGPGGLTRALLLEGAHNVVAVEFDERAVAALQSLKHAANGRLEIIHQDALTFDVGTLDSSSFKIVANLPYNIATPLLIGWLKVIHRMPERIQSMTLMFQKEVADRITAQPGNKIYGRLSVLTQWLCRVHQCFDIPPEAFSPPPKIISTVIQATPKAKYYDDIPFHIMENLTAQAFNQRRKMVRSTLKAYLPALEECGIDPSLRAENLSCADYISLSRIIAREA